MSRKLPTPSSSSRTRLITQMQHTTTQFLYKLLYSLYTLYGTALNTVKYQHAKQEQGSLLALHK